MASVYIASPYGFSKAVAGFYHDLLGRLAKAGFRPVDPWKHPGVRKALRQASSIDEMAARRAAFRATNEKVAQENVKKLRRADAVLAILDGADVDSGTASEIGFAAALGKPMVGLRLDTRRTGDNDGASVNLQVEHFITRGERPIVGSVAEAISQLSRVLRR